MFDGWSTSDFKNYDAILIETRPCGECKHYRRLIDGSICHKHLMTVLPDMYVNYMATDETCWENKDEPT